MDLLRVDRLKRIFNPFFPLLSFGSDDAVWDGFPPARIELLREEMLRHEPISEFVEMEKRAFDAPWHWGRIRHFYERFLAGDTDDSSDPIVIDNQCFNGHVYPALVVDDGHHRLCGAYLAGVEFVDVSYGGRVDLLEWLEGKSDDESFFDE